MLFDLNMLRWSSNFVTFQVLQTLFLYSVTLAVILAQLCVLISLSGFLFQPPLSFTPHPEVS